MNSTLKYVLAIACVFLLFGVMLIAVPAMVYSFEPDEFRCSWFTGGNASLNIFGDVYVKL